jgi:hypothetical protein
LKKLNNNYKIRKLFLISIILSCTTVFVWCGQAVASSLPIFPGAEGFGTTTRAAYGGNGNPVIYIVNTLSDNTTTPQAATINGTKVYKGSLRACLTDKIHTQAGQGRIILFEKSGVINLTKGFIKLEQPYLTIAGQSAPNPGVIIKGYRFRYQTHDTFIQHVRIRRGPDDTGASSDGISMDGPNHTLVVDHCSISWTCDEIFDVYGNITDKNVTFSNCIFSEPLAYKNNLKPGAQHAYGPIVGPNNKNVALIRNIFAHNQQRNPLLHPGTKVVLLNNIIYNYQDSGIYLNGPGNSTSHTIVNNYFKKGPSSSSVMIALFPQADGSKLYLSGNHFQNDKTTPSTIDDQWLTFIKYFGGADQSAKVYESPISLAGFTVWPANDAFNRLVNEKNPIQAIDTVGAYPAFRDSVDLRILNDVANGTGRVINDPDYQPTWPKLTVKTRVPNIPDNPHGDADNDGYTNLEEWLHNLSSEVEGRSLATKGVSPPKGLKILESF